MNPKTRPYAGHLLVNRIPIIEKAQRAMQIVAG